LAVIFAASMDKTAYYRVTVRGRVTERLASAFDGMRVEPGQGMTAFVGHVQDQAALYGLLNRLRDFGLELVQVEEVEK
jgi:hypothetical protein